MKNVAEKKQSNKLYVLRFTNPDMMKIGIASSMARIISLKRTYKEFTLDLSRSLIFESHDEKVIKRLENQLLYDTAEYRLEDESIKGCDGYTEIRDVKVWNTVVEEIHRKMACFENQGIIELDFQNMYDDFIVTPISINEVKNKLRMIIERKARVRKEDKSIMKAAEELIYNRSFLEKYKNYIEGVSINNYGYLVLSLNNTESIFYDDSGIQLMNVVIPYYKSEGDSKMIKGAYGLFMYFDRDYESKTIEYCLKMDTRDADERDENHLGRTYIDEVLSIFDLKLNRGAYYKEIDTVRRMNEKDFYLIGDKLLYEDAHKANFFWKSS